MEGVMYFTVADTVGEFVDIQLGDTPDPSPGFVPKLSHVCFATSFC